MTAYIIAALCLAVGYFAGNMAASRERFHLRWRLNALRRNCFVTDERGHRVRYIKASDAMQAKAER